MDLVPDLDPEGEWTVPPVESTEDFDLSRALKDRGQPTGEYEVLAVTSTVKESVTNWEALFIQFKDENGGLRPVKVALPSIADEEEEEVIPSSSKGKRKAGPQDFSD
ncbi:hypothetical protein BC835DRAFT_396778 [Cytidiella melzeri]|nr:hypothetical protein BC835DRAFT_396778 [Cytidiella melzeri]